MSLDQDQVSDFARNYTDAWCSGDPTRVAAHFAPGGTIAINGPPTGVTEVARSFGTNTGPGGTGNQVRFSGFEEWTFGEDGLVAESQGHYDQAEYERQLEQGAPEPQ
jgi:nuclear transport factor 2 (NTF2) superfamily protein